MWWLDRGQASPGAALIFFEPSRFYPAATSTVSFLIYRKFKNSFPGGLRPESGVVGEARQGGEPHDAGDNSSTAVRLHAVFRTSPVPGGAVKSLKGDCSETAWKTFSRAGSKLGSGSARRWCYRAPGPAPWGTLPPVGAGGTRRAQRIRWPLRSRSGSTPKLFFRDAAHRRGHGFPSRSCPSRAKTASCVWHFTRGARSPKYRMLCR